MTETVENQPNDIIVRVHKAEDGKISYELFLAVNDEAMIPTMEKTAEHIGNMLLIMDRPDAEIEYAAPSAFADRLAH